jgi:hypothetical protein
MAEALKTFREGEDILASETNENNQYLLSRLTDNAAQIQSYVEGEIATVKSNVASVQATLQNNFDELEQNVSTLKETMGDGLAPDYAQGVSISLPYTVTADGYVYAGVDGIDAPRYVRVNGKIVHGHCGYSGGYGVYSGSLIRVSKGDSVTCDRALWNYYFYPLKGVK